MLRATREGDTQILHKFDPPANCNFIDCSVVVFVARHFCLETFDVNPPLDARFSSLMLIGSSIVSPTLVFVTAALAIDETSILSLHGMRCRLPHGSPTVSVD